MLISSEVSSEAMRQSCGKHECSKHQRGEQGSSAGAASASQPPLRKESSVRTPDTNVASRAAVQGLYQPHNHPCERSPQCGLLTQTPAHSALCTGCACRCPAPTAHPSLHSLPQTLKPGLLTQTPARSGQCVGCARPCPPPIAPPPPPHP